MVGRLLLNRTNRIYMRKLREVTVKAMRVKELLAKRQSKILEDWHSETLTNEQAKKRDRLINWFTKALCKSSNSLDLNSLLVEVF